MEPDTYVQSVKDTPTPGQREHPVRNGQRVVVGSLRHRFSFPNVRNVIRAEPRKGYTQALPLSQRNYRRRKVVLGILVVGHMRKASPTVTDARKLIGIGNKAQIIPIYCHGGRSQGRRPCTRFHVKGRIGSSDPVGSKGMSTADQREHSAQESTAKAMECIFGH